ncbi:SlyX family protein [Candidatus Vondammii sp. HM_W22]|uniref:SlyX family protein n=1 Tax=Candidatus Vondammii sp. HM_W22 TaxID=2687299 RepID=UPI001F13E8DE|nr:SlyX family protein [Candidatus Vondammii sp. HM_W22]
MEKELIDLQTRVAFQEDAIQQLNLTMVHQQNIIDVLQRGFLELRQQIQALTPPDAPETTDEAPPHY